MDRQLPRFAILSLAVWGAAACKKDAPLKVLPPRPPASTPALSAAEVCEMVFGAPARHLAASCTPPERSTVQYGYLQRLAATNASFCTLELAPLMERGNVQIDDTVARQCGQRLEKTSWKEALSSADLDRFPECRRLILGKRAEGEPCDSAQECERGMGCVSKLGAEGRCQSPGSIPACPPRLVWGPLSPLGAGIEAAGRDETATSRERDPAPVRPATEGGIQVESTVVQGRIPPEAIGRVTRAHLGSLQRCYDEGLARDPRLAGQVTVRFVLQKEGRLTNIEGSASSLPDESVIGCVVRAFRGMSFPRFEGGIGIATQVLDLSPGGAPAVDGAPTRRCTDDPLTALGGTCTGEDDCTPDLYCRDPEGLSAASACARRRSAGEPCASSLQCSGLCRDGRCASFCGAL